MGATFVLGQVVKVDAPGRRPFEAPILAIRPLGASPAVDVKDPRNGGLKTVSLDHIEPVRPTCEACGHEIPKGRRRSQNEAGQLVCSECRP